MAATTTSKSKAGAAKAFIESGNGSGGPNPAEDLQRQIAEAAYYRAEKRGFAPGGEVDDWLAAVEEIGPGFI